MEFNMRKRLVVLGVICSLTLVTLASKTNFASNVFNSIKQSSLSKAFFASEEKKDSHSTSKPENRSQTTKFAQKNVEQNVPDRIVYFILFNHLVGLKKQSETAEASGEVSLDYFSLYKRQASLDDSQSQFLFQNAQDCLDAIKPIDEQAKSVIDRARANFPNGEMKSPEIAQQKELPTTEKEIREILLARKERLKKLSFRLKVVSNDSGEQQSQFHIDDKISLNLFAANFDVQPFRFTTSSYDNLFRPILVKNGKEVTYTQKAQESLIPPKEHPIIYSNIMITLLPYKETSLGFINIGNWYDSLEVGVYQVKMLCNFDRWTAKHLYNLNKKLAEDLRISDKGLIEIESDTVTFEILPKE